MKRAEFLTLAIVSTAIAGAASPADADSTGTMSGSVTNVTDKLLQIDANRVNYGFVLGSDLKGVYSADGKTPRKLSDLKPGMLVRVTFIKTFVGNNYRKATEVDIITGYQLPLPLHT
jgi:hypothetical protein